MAKKIDKDGLLLCELQAKTFELSASAIDTSSEIFIRRFAYSEMARIMDNTSILQTNIQPQDIIERINEEYGVSNYGSVKYTLNELFWIGYIYRYFSYTYDWSSTRVYKTIKPKELRGLFLPYHTMDPAAAIERILEAKRMLPGTEENLQRQYEIFKRVRLGEII